MDPLPNPYASPPGHIDGSAETLIDTREEGILPQIDMAAYETGRALPWLWAMLVIFGLMTMLLVVSSMFAIANMGWRAIVLLVPAFVVAFPFIGLLNVRRSLLDLQLSRRVETLTMLVLRLRTLFAMLVIIFALGLLLQVSTMLMKMLFIGRSG